MQVFKIGKNKMIKKIIEKITNLLLAKQLSKQKQLTESFNNNVQLLNTHRTKRKSKKKIISTWHKEIEGVSYLYNYKKGESYAKNINLCLLCDINYVDVCEYQ